MNLDALADRIYQFFLEAGRAGDRERVKYWARHYNRLWRLRKWGCI